jgi:hypothetical protein
MQGISGPSFRLIRVVNIGVRAVGKIIALIGRGKSLCIVEIVNPEAFLNS